MPENTKPAVKHRVLFKTIIGSHMWNMGHINSDVDYFVCFAYDTREILRNLRALQESFFVHTAREDTHYHEIGKVVEQLLKGNLNYILGVMSPVIVITSRYHKKLKELLERYPPRNAYHSIRGFAINNYERALKEESPPTEHRLNKILRVLEFGITLLKTGVYEFRAVSGATPDLIKTKLKELDAAYRKSTLNERIPEDAIRDLLLEIRLENLKDVE